MVRSYSINNLHNLTKFCVLVPSSNSPPKFSTHSLSLDDASKCHGPQNIGRKEGSYSLFDLIFNPFKNPREIKDLPNYLFIS